MTVARGKFIAAMRQAAAGVWVVTTDGPAGRSGVTVSAACSLSADPPSVLACVHGMSHVLPMIRDNKVFALNILEAEQWFVADTFAGRVPRLREDRFSCAEWEIGVTGAPMLRGAVASFDCGLEAEMQYASHWILIGSVEGCHGCDGVPLVYANRGYCEASPIAAP